MTLQDKKVVVIGGSDGMGLATAEAALAAGAVVVIASRSEAKLKAAAAHLGGSVETAVLDATVEDDVRALFARLGPIDHVVTTAAVVSRKPVFEVSLDEAKSAFDNKFWSQFIVCRNAHAQIRPGGSITLFSGISSRRGLPSLVVASAINGAVEALCRSMALTLAPVRVNAVCPGYVDTPSHDASPARRAVLDAVAARLPVQRVGHPDELARAALFLMQSEYSTGSVVDVDGGHLAG